MASGLVRVQGTIDPAQFWPGAGSDADTITVAVDEVTFQAHPGAPFRKTNAFANAEVRGRGRSPAIENGSLQVRLQGIDATELHYRPTAAKKPSQQSASQRKRYLELNDEYRQPYAETASVALHRFVDGARKNAAGLVKCRVETAVSAPFEVFDTYGRFVGDALVQPGSAGTWQNLNTWLARKGLAVPTFYNSMSEAEIERITRASDAAFGAGLGVWREYFDRVPGFDRQCIYRRPTSKPVFDAAADRGTVLMPKLFRRQSAWWVNRGAGMVNGNLLAYLRANRDDCHLTDDYLAQGAEAATVCHLDDFLHADGFFELWPEQLVFRESASRLVRNGTDVTSW